MEYKSKDELIELAQMLEKDEEFLLAMKVNGGVRKIERYNKIMEELDPLLKEESKEKVIKRPVPR